jgi:hypothetical protein
MFIYRFEDFLKQTHSLSELKTYPQLLQRSDRIGYTIQKVVFRGYHASDQLQVHRKYCCHTESCIDNIFTLSENISFIYTSFRNRKKKDPLAIFSGLLSQVKPNTIIKTGICCFSGKHAALSSKSIDWLAQIQDNVSEWNWWGIFSEIAL